MSKEKKEIPKVEHEVQFVGKIKNEPTTNDLLKLLIGKIDKLTDDLKPKTIEAPLPVPEEMVEGVEKQVKKEPTNYPIPMEYREVVDTILSKEFKLEMTPLSDQPAFQVDIIVPTQYSNATKDHLELYGSDRRSRVIKFSEGTNGVREWADKVAKNLGTEIMTKVSIAREQVKV